MSRDEDIWVARALQGEPAAFEGLVGKYQARLVAFLWNLLGSGDDARDAAQDAFIQAFLRLDQYDRSRTFKSWLFAIAFHRGLDMLRQRRRFRRFWTREAASGDPPPAGSAVDPSFWHHALLRVTPQERAALALKYNEDCAGREIAATLGCSESTVRVHLLNARRKLKKELDAAGFARSRRKAEPKEAP